jgi:plasmid stabilization system protein ParE
VRLRFAKAARNDLRALKNYIAADSPEPPERAAAVIARIRVRCRLLLAAPRQGRVRELPGVPHETRSVPEPPYVIFHPVAGNVVEVVRVVDGRRELGTAFFSE